MILHQKPAKNEILRGLKLHRFTLNQINLDKKVSQNHRKVIKSNEAYFREKSQAHINATYAITNFIGNF